MAAEVGSDCPLFLRDAPVIMRGRGERLEDLPAEVVQRLAEKRVLVFKPGFSINTAWAYRTLAQGAPRGYLPTADAEAWLRSWIKTPVASVHDLGFNSLEVPAFDKHLALPTMIKVLQHKHGVRARMSGSGSACYAFLDTDAAVDDITATIREGWGEAALCEVTRIRDGVS